LCSDITNLVIGCGAAGMIAANTLARMQVPFHISYPADSTLNEQKWIDSDYKSIFHEGKYGNLTLWGSCLRKIPFKNVSKAFPGILEYEYEISNAEVLSYCGVTVPCWQNAGFSLYYHYKRNLLKALVESQQNTVDIGEVVKVELRQGKYLVTDDSGKKFVCDNLIFCTPIPVTIRLLKDVINFEGEDVRCNEHFIYLKAHFHLKEKVSPSNFQAKTSEVSVRKHLDSEHTSILLLPRLSANNTSDQTIVEVRREAIQRVLSKKYLGLIFLAAKYPIEIVSLFLWSINLHPKTRYYDSIVMVNREVTVSEVGDIKGPQENWNCILGAEKDEIMVAADFLGADVSFSGDELSENSQHLHGMRHKALKLDMTRKLDDHQIYLLGANALNVVNVSNITLSLMTITKILLRKIYGE